MPRMADISRGVYIICIRYRCMPGSGKLAKSVKRPHAENYSADKLLLRDAANLRMP